uniref:Uncharacterized protein n=1 Tax=Amphimedon queenslandica TaxID=400682 RepID=A0A1X7UI42_AMPQE
MKYSTCKHITSCLLLSYKAVKLYCCYLLQHIETHTVPACMCTESTCTGMLSKVPYFLE